jgi:uncharacterized RDD family membrane protein YckC
VPVAFKGACLIPEHKYQTGGARFLAMLIDGFIVSAVTSVIDWMMRPEWGAGVNIVLGIIFSAITPAYPIYMHGRFGQTFGKFIAGVRVIDINGGRVSYKQAAVRDFVPLLLAPIPMWYISHFYITGDLPSAALFKAAYALALLWVVLELLTMLLNDRRRAIHDFIANTVVIRAR